MTRHLYEFRWDCSRMGRLLGLFVAEEKEVEDAIGKQVYFGEVLGKHSEIEGELEKDDVCIKSSDENFINQFVEIIGMSFGRNPLEYIRETCEVCGEHFDKGELVEGNNGEKCCSESCADEINESEEPEP